MKDDIAYMPHYLLYTLLGLIVFTGTTSAQSISDIQEVYTYNITQTYINDVYIPEDVNEAMQTIDRLSNNAGREKMLEIDEESAANKLIPAIGRWMIVNWNLVEGSRLGHRLRDYGVFAPEDQAKFLIVSYHRYLRGVPLELEKRGKLIHDMRYEEQQNRIRERLSNPD